MKKIIYFSLIMLGASLSGCSGFLDEDPHLKQSNELTLSNFDGLNKAAIGMYTSLNHTNWYGSAFTIQGDLRADNAKSSPKSSGRYQIDYNWNYNKANTLALWATAYAVVTRACNVINGIETYGISTDVGVTQEEVDHLKGEALFLRALANFDLVRTYAQPYTYAPEGAGIPLILVSSLEKPARATTSKIYEQIVSDLTEAIPLFMDDFYEDHRDGTVDVKGFASADAAKALLARVYLYMGDYTNAAKYATMLIESSDYTLYTADNYTSVWGKDAQSEIIMEVYGSTGNANNPYWENIGNMYNPDGSYGDVCATKGLVDLFEDGDVRAELFVQPDDYPGFYWPTKYPGKNGDIKQDNIPLFRLSEMYLIRAEAGLNGVQGVDALADYNEIRTHRGLTRAGSVTKTDLFNERRRELCFEGHLVFDYARLQMSLTRVDEDNRLTNNKDIPFPNYKWAAPIPQAELNSNPNMVQNDGY